jgi:hypothetical protein
MARRLQKAPGSPQPPRSQEAETARPLPGDLFETKAEENEYWSESYWPNVESTVQQLNPLLSNTKFTDDWEFIYTFG